MASARGADCPPVAPIVLPPALAPNVQPAVIGVGGVQAQAVEWNTMVGDLKLQQFELAFWMLHAVQHVTVAEAMEVSQRELPHMAQQDVAALKDREKLLGTLPVARHFLTVIGGKFCIITSPRVCGYAPNPMERVYGFINDRTWVISEPRQPTMVKTTGSIADQWEQFAFVEIEALEWDATVAWAESGQGDLAPMLVAAAAGDPANPTTTTLRMLPVHAKIAALFMRGVPLREGVQRVQALRNLVPVQDQGKCKALVDFMRVAVADDGHGTTTINTSWTRVDHGSTRELYGLCTQWLNVWQNQYPVTAPPPREDSPRSVTTLPPEWVAQCMKVRMCDIV